MMRVRGNGLYGLPLFALLLMSTFAQAGYGHLNDYYQGVYDAEGNALVIAKIRIDNTSGSEIREMILELPGGSQLYHAVQEPGLFANPAASAPVSGVPEAIAFHTREAADATIAELVLPVPIAPRDNASIVLLYQIPRYAARDVFGNHSFVFETIRDPNADEVAHILVHIDLQPGLALKGGLLGLPPSGREISLNTLTPLFENLASPEYRTFSGELLYSETPLALRTSNPHPLEEWEITGTYSPLFVTLYLPEILWSVGILIVMFLLLKKFGSILATGSGMVGSAMGIASLDRVGNVKLSVLVGLVSGALINIWWMLSPFLLQPVNAEVLSTGTVLSFHFTVLSLLVSAFLLLAPAVYYSSRRGISVGIGMVGITLIAWWGIAIAMVLVGSGGMPQLGGK